MSSIIFATYSPYGLGYVTPKLSDFCHIHSEPETFLAAPRKALAIQKQAHMPPQHHVRCSNRFPPPANTKRHIHEVRLQDRDHLSGCFLLNRKHKSRLARPVAKSGHLTKRGFARGGIKPERNDFLHQKKEPARMAKRFVTSREISKPVQ